MIFVVDIGNSHTVVGLYDNDALLHQWRVKSDRQKTPDEIAIQFNALFSMSGVDKKKIRGIIIASVVPTLETAWLNCCKQYFSTYLNHEIFVVNDISLQTLISIKTDYPNEVGADRIVNGIAGWVRFGTHVIVVDFGTAITFDCITENCEYLGGSIIPGVSISLEALSKRAAKLPHIDISQGPSSAIGKNTIDAMKSGVLYGYGAMIDGLIQTLSEEMCPLGEKVNAIATGGMAPLVIPYSKRVNSVDQMLTLNGLHHIYTHIYEND